jgi:hypothetical protein
MSTDEPIYTKGQDLEKWYKSGPEKRQALELKYKYQYELIKNPIVTGVGGGATRMRIYIDPDASPEEKEKIPRKLDGCDIDVIEQESATPAGAVDERHRPLVGGIRVQPGFGGGGMLCGIAEGDSEGSLTKYAVVPLHVIAEDVRKPVAKSLYQPDNSTRANYVGALWEKANRWLEAFLLIDRPMSFSSPPTT